MTEAAPAAATAPAAPPPATNGGTPPPAAPAPWHQGVEPEYIGHWQNRGLPLDDPKAIAVEMTKAHRGAESKLGIPADQVLRMPKPDAPEAEIKAFHMKLGAPAEAKDYDFSEVKYADGEALEPEFADALRAACARKFVPKDAAVEIAKELAKFADGDQQSLATAKTAAVQQEKAALAKEWAQNYDANLFIAKQGAKVLGMTPEQITELEGITGYAGVMKMMHRVGVLNKEDRFIAPGGNNTGMLTADQAVARKKDLFADSGWRARHGNGDVAAVNELKQLNRIITGDFETPL